MFPAADTAGDAPQHHASLEKLRTYLGGGGEDILLGGVADEVDRVRLSFRMAASAVPVLN
jgi:hypothetical protein